MKRKGEHLLAEALAAVLWTDLEEKIPQFLATMAGKMLIALFRVTPLAISSAAGSSFHRGTRNGKRVPKRIGSSRSKFAAIMFL
jgi:hypothetical protein